jgi:hypothetical protein
VSRWTRGRVGLVGFLVALGGLGMVALQVPRLGWTAKTATVGSCDDMYTGRYGQNHVDRCAVTWTLEGGIHSANVDFPYGSVHEGDRRVLRVHGDDAVDPDGVRRDLLLYGAMGTAGLVVLVITIVSAWRSRGADVP